MINVCPGCGQYRADKIPRQQEGSVVCPECDAVEPWRFRPLLLVGGASGSGKTALCRHLSLNGCGAIPLEADILWNPYYDKPEEQYQTFFNTWLRLAKNIAQCGEPIVLFGAGFGVPENIEELVERRYFSETHYLALVCEPQALAARLEARPAWRESARPSFLQAQLEFNRWLTDHGPSQKPAVTLLDTTTASVEETAAGLQAWIRSSLDPAGSARPERDA